MLRLGKVEMSSQRSGLAPLITLTSDLSFGIYQLSLFSSQPESDQRVQRADVYSSVADRGNRKFHPGPK